jgi:hypothetical protein
MNLEELFNVVSFAYQQSNNYGGNRAELINVGIKVAHVGTVGGTPVVPVKHLTMGFDWDSNKLIIIPEIEVRSTTRDEVKAIQDAYDKAGWTQLKIDQVDRQNKKLKKQVEELQSKLESK